MTRNGGELVGRRLGNWELTRVIGEGSFGAVYEARNVMAEGRRVAVKVLHTALSYDVMELLRGVTLFDLLYDERLDAARVVGIGTQVARALHAAHQQGVIHR